MRTLSITSITPTSLLGLAALAFALTGCPDKKKTPLGGTCGSDAECAQGECIANLCLDPDGDEDGDGLSNRLEASLGTNPLVADTDGDGIPDGEEIGNISAPIDTDGDGKPDAIESTTADADQDCIPDQFDPDDDTPADPQGLAAFACKKVGACAADGAVITASCPTDLTPVCNYTQVPQYEASETRCDGVDNDCDGETDENHGANGAVVFDGGGYAGDAGKTLGQACGAGACVGGAVVCAVDMASLVCSTSDRAGAPTCDADNDCNGVDDLSEIVDPLTTTLLGCVDHFIDADGDTFGVDDEVKCLCEPAGDYTVLVGGDCADGDDEVYPNAPAICGVDADCVGGLLDAGEVCDDGNDDPSDGCDACKVVGLVLAGGLDGDASPRIANLAGGGFGVAWNNGYDVETWLGTTLVVFGQDGVEVGRHEGLGLGDRPNYGNYALAASGDVLLYLEWTFEGQGYRLTARRFGPDGAEIGTPIALSPPSEPSWSFGATATAPGGFWIWWVEGLALRLVHLGADGTVGEPGGFEDLDAWDIYDVDAIGFEDGTLVMTWVRAWIDGDFWTQERLRQRFDDEGTAIGDPVGTDDGIRVRLARWSGGWAMLRMVENQIDEDYGVTVLAQRYTDETRVGPALTVVEFDTLGCPYDFEGGFDADDNAYAVYSDGECRSPARGTVLLDGVATPVPLGVESLPETSYTGELGASHGGPLTVAFTVRDSRTGSGPLLLYRFGPGLQPVWVRVTPPPL